MRYDNLVIYEQFILFIYYCIEMYFYGSSVADTVLKSVGSAPPTPPLEITIVIWFLITFPTNSYVAIHVQLLPFGLQYLVA